MFTEHLAVPTFAHDPEAALAAYQQLGYHIEPNIWTEEDCQQLIQSASTLPSYQDGTLIPAMQLHRQEAVFLDALRNPKIVRIMERLVGGQVSGLQTVFYFTRPGTTGFALHQDNFRVEAKQDAFASAWSALRDITPEMGGLYAYPGSHREPLLPVEPLNTVRDPHQDPNASHEQAVLPSGYDRVDLTVPRGSVIFLHGHLLHGSYQNRTDQFRYALLMTYIRRGEKFRPGNYAARAEVDVYNQ